MNSALTLLPSPDLSGSHRRAALVLHALDAVDRQWALEQLDREHRLALEGALAELVELGIPADPTLVDAALATHDGALTADPRIEFLSKQSAEAVLMQLRGEPKALITTVLSLHPWPWAAGVSTELGVEAAQGQAPQGLRDDLLNELVSRLADAGTHTPVNHTPFNGASAAYKLRLVLRHVWARLGGPMSRGGQA